MPDKIDQNDAQISYSPPSGGWGRSNICKIQNHKSALAEVKKRRKNEEFIRTYPHPAWCVC